LPGTRTTHHRILCRFKRLDRLLEDAKRSAAADELNVLKLRNSSAFEKEPH
jgi:hypothetical protein